MEKISKNWVIVAILIVAISAFCVALTFSGTNYNKLTGIVPSGDNQGNTRIYKIIPAEHISMNVLSPIDHFIINATVPEMPSTFAYYKDTYQRSDVVDEKYNSTLKVRPNVTSEDAAPALAQQALAPYGGLPSDAVMIYSKTSYGEAINGTTGEIIRRDPVETTVLYERNLNGSTIKGMHDMAYVTFGDYGEILELRRIWGTIQYTGRDIPVISVYDAIRKLEERDVINPTLDGAEVIINSIYLGHYGYKWTNQTPETYLEPIWVFTGTFPSGNYCEFYVYARQFATFTVTPTTQNATLPVRFTDTSDASPTKWLWDFGDGTNSTVQNATHSFAEPGTYNVSLRAWNDLGSDTIVKQYIVNEPPPKFIDNITVTVNNTYFKKIDGIDYNWNSFFSICSQAGYACNYTQNRVYNDRRYLYNLTVNGKVYPPPYGIPPANYGWNIVTSLDGDAILVKKGLGGWAYDNTDTYYFWYGNNTAARSCFNGQCNWLFPTVGNATYIVKIDIIHSDE